MELALAEQVGRRVADVGDEQVRAEAQGHGQRRPHAREPRVVLGLLDDRLIHVAEPPGGPGDHLLHQGLVGRQDPVGRLECELDEEGDRHPARDLPGGHPAHAVGHDHAIARIRRGRAAP